MTWSDELRAASPDVLDVAALLENNIRRFHA